MSRRICRKALSHFPAHCELACPLEPRLEHQYVPQMSVPLVLAAKILRPEPGDGAGQQVSIAGNACRLQQLLCPGSQWPMQPVADGRSEADLRQLDERVGQVAPQQLPQDPLLLPVTQLKRGGDAEGELDHTIVEQR